MIGDGEVQTKQFESIAVKLFCIVGDDDIQNPKSANDVFPNKILGILFSDLGERFYLHPLRKIVYGDDQKLYL